MDTEEIVMKARIPNLSYLAVGFGKTMRGTDMIVWRWKDDVTIVDNLYSTKYDTPPSDGTDFLKSRIETTADNRYKIIETRRALDTGHAKDYVIEPDKEYIWCYAYLTGKGDFKYHEHQELFSVKFSSTGLAVETNIDLKDAARNTFFEAHGWWMWSVWMPVGLLLLITKRYAKKNWNCMHVMHALLGLTVLVVTLVWSFKILDYFSWKLNTNLHSVVGIVSVILCLVVALSGSLTASLAQFYNGEKDWTPRETVTKIGKFHKWAGYLTLFIGNATAMTGIYHYYNDIVGDDHFALAGYLSLAIFCTLVMIFECFYR